MKIQDLKPPVAIPEPEWKRQLVEFWQGADEFKRIDLQVLLKMGDAEGAHRLLESWQQEVVERRKKKTRKKSKAPKQKFVWGGYWTPGYNFGGTELGGEGGGDGGGGGESVREASTPDGVSASTKMFLEQDSASTTDIVRDFVDFCVGELGIEAQPRLRLRRDPVWSQRNHSFGQFDPASNELNVSIADRHVMDILRTVAHELVHYHQQEQQDLPADAGETGSEYENEANARAGELMRDYGQTHPELFEPGAVAEGWRERLGSAALAAACVAGTPGCATTGQLAQGAQIAARTAQTMQGRDLKGIARAELEQELKNFARAQRGDANAQNLSRIYQAQRRAQQNESSGYIPTKKERNDPRFSMALSPDVQPGATGKNANKMALKTGPQGEPTLLMKGLQNALREFKETGQLPLTEDQDLFEINMSPSNLKRLVKDIDARAGIEFEMIVPDVNVEEEGELEQDMDMDERVRDIDDVIRFFDDGDYNSSRDIRNLREELEGAFFEYRNEQIDEQWDNQGQDYLRDWIFNNDLFDRDEAMAIARDQIIDANPDMPVDSDEFQDLVSNRVDELADDFASDSWAGQGEGYDDAREAFVEEQSDTIDEEDWLESEGIQYASDVSSNYDIAWPYYTTIGGDAKMDIDSVAEDFSRAIGRPVNASDRYHGGRREAGHYVVEPDSSLDPDDSNDGGLEFVSPPLPLDELLSDLEKVRAWAKRRGCYTNDSTGLHMNVSVPDTSTAKLDYVKLALLLGDERVLNEFGRAANTYTKSAMGKIRDILKNKPQAANEVLEKMREHMGALATKVIHTGNTDKYTSINTKGNYVEFRSPGGDYLDANWDKVVPTLMRTVVALDAAMDPEKYRQEYQKKLYKLLNPDGLKDEYGDMVQEFSNYMVSLQGNQTELPDKLSKKTQQAIKDFRKTTTQQLKQSNLARSADKDKDIGKMWWRVGMKSNPNYAIEVVGSRRSEAIQAAVDANTDLNRFNPATDFTAKPIRPYQEPPQQTPDGAWGIWATDLEKFVTSRGEIRRFASSEDVKTWIEQYQQRGAHRDVKLEPREVESQEVAAAASGQGNTRTFRAFDVGNGNTVGTFQASGAKNSQEANVAFSQYIQSLGRTNTAGYDYDEAEPLPDLFPDIPAAPQTWYVSVIGQPDTEIEIRSAANSNDAAQQAQTARPGVFGAEAGNIRAARVPVGRGAAAPDFGQMGSNTTGQHRYQIIRMSDRRQVGEFNADTQAEAELHAHMVLGNAGLDSEDYDVRQAPAAAGTTGEFTGEWKIVSPNGEEIHRFGGIGNVQADANRVAIEWLRRNPGRMQAGVEVVPVMAE
jgi:hypothetical protein